jgi:hypothetical protein
VTRFESADLQRNPLTEEPETPAISIAGGHRVHLLAIPIERLVVKPALVDAAAVPVDRAGTATVISVVTTRWLPGAVAPPWICTCRSKSNTE